MVKKVMMISYLSYCFTDLPGRRTVPRNYKRSTVACEHTYVSIITPDYNPEEFFVETCLSLQTQSLQNWEWVIVDDGSTDQESVNRLIKGTSSNYKRPRDGFTALEAATKQGGVVQALKAAGATE